MEVKGTILAKKADNKAFKLSDDNWYNLNDNVIPYLEKISKGEFVTIQYEKKGTSRYVSKISNGQEVEPVSTMPKTVPSTGFACEVCGATLKDGKSKKCYMCNKAGAVKTDTSKPATTQENATGFVCEDCGVALKDGKYKKCYPCGKKGFKKGSGEKSYDNPAKTAQIQRGNALNAAGAVAASQQFADPETAIEYTLILADRFLEWLRAE